MAHNKKLKVMLATEGTYPFHYGGVSTWCDFLVNQLFDVDYVVYSVVMNPFVIQKYNLPPNASLIRVPLWGTEDAGEHLMSPFHEIYLTKRKTDSLAIKNDFLPLFSDLMEEIISQEKDPSDFARILHNLYQYTREYDYTVSFKAQITWDIFKNIVLRHVSDSHNKLPWPSAFDLIQSIGWIYRFFTILNTPVPRVDVAHSAAAAFCGIPCVLAKLEYGAPYLLTEHGVYLREQYLSANRMNLSSYQKTFLLRLVHSIISLNYHMADQVSPVCNFNTRWEKELGVRSDKISVIYNGVDRNIFSPGAKKTEGGLTVVSVARIDPVKDFFNLLQAAAVVREQIPDVKFVVYGSVGVPNYYEECLALRSRLNLEETFIFAGHTDDVPNALRQADVVVLSSITEGFPYSVVEAMMAGKAIVATDVGGVKEALADCGIVVPPRNPEALARGLITLLSEPQLRTFLEEEARRRALNVFTLEKATQSYYKAYRKLYFTRLQDTELNQKRQKLFADKGYALLDMGYYREAIEQFKKAVDIAPESPAVPVILADMARAYARLGDYDMADAQLEKAKLIAHIIEDRTA